MSYTPIADGEIDQDSPVTESLLTRLRDNFEGQANADSGAPKFQSGSFDAGNTYDADKIGAGAVHQSELNTSNGSSFHTGTGGSTYILPGGAYGFYPQLTVNAGNFSRVTIYERAIAQTQATYIYLQNTTVSSATVTAYQEYVNSSPPFDLGDGDIPFFCFVWMRGGVIWGGYMADVPPWAYNGPTNIAGQKSQAVKNADMNLIPHPFAPEVSDPTDRFILLDPVSSEMEGIKALHSEGAFDIETLRDYMTIGNTALTRNTPAGVDAMGISWKNNNA